MSKSKQKRVFVITNMYPSRKNKQFGIFIRNQVEALKNRGLTVEVAAIREQRAGKFFVIKKYFIWVMHIIYSLLFKGKSYDVIHAHYIFPCGLWGVWFKKLFGTRLVVTAHGGDIDKMAKKGTLFFKQTKKILQQADQVIAVGDHLKTEIVTDFGIHEEKITIINMGVNRNVFAPVNKNKAKKQLNLPEERVQLLFVGNLIKAKGLYELIEAYSQLKKASYSIELHLIGTVKDPTFINQLKQKISDEKIEDVFFHSPKNQQDISLWMSASDVFVLPSHMEGFGLVALEAMSCHTPVVGSDVGGLSYLLSDGTGVLIEPHNINSLQNGIEMILNSSDFRNSLIRLGEKKAREYEEEKQLDKLLGIYEMIGARQKS
ncbi:glycosyltransferase [Virgibacillus sp. L01]|uniref:glycosyltransferase n=1 Tax=Virgibacillus sp. L01 TaxID=3457429 RepID=UPI003FD4FF66